VVAETVSSLYSKMRKILFASILVLLVLLTLQLLFRFLILPRMEIAQILLESTLNLSDSELLELGGITGSENYMSLDEKEIEAKYESSPLIRKAYVEKQFPATLKLVLYGRSALGLLMIEEEGVHKPLVFDEYGVLYRTVSASPYQNLPVLSGLKFEEDHDSLLPESLSPLLSDLKALQSDSPLLFAQISEIEVKRIEGALYEVHLYTSAYKLPVVLSSRLTDSIMKKILLVLDSLNSSNQIKDLEYADFRADQVVLKTREGN
jgi:cell division septal protein FtsQ